LLLASVVRAKCKSALLYFRTDCVWPKADFVEPTAEEGDNRCKALALVRGECIPTRRVNVIAVSE